MSKNITSSYHQQPDEAFFTKPIIDPSSIEIVTTQPPDDPDFVVLETTKVEPERKGRFRKGFDPRRHQFTTEECQLGFERAIESLVVNHPDWIMKDGRHAACNFLKAKARKGVAA